jgi:hypothetical protein
MYKLHCHQHNKELNCTATYTNPLPSQPDKIEQAPQLQGVLALLNLYLYHHILKHAPLLQGDILNVSI